MISSMSWTLMRSLRPLAKDRGVTNCKGGVHSHRVRPGYKVYSNMLISFVQGRLILLALGL